MDHLFRYSQKDKKIVAVAYFNAGGTVSQFVQHMTYPYNLETSHDREFWDEPDKNGVMLIMDGLDLGHAEKNFLFGNSWPVKYAEVAEQKHPEFEDFGFSKFKSTTTFGKASMPVEIETENVNDEFHSFYDKRIERFDYDDKKVSNYKLILLMDLSMFPGRENRSSGNEEQIQEDVNFLYEGMLLTEMTFKNKKYRFYYESNKQVKAEYYVNNRIYNTRKYLYNDRGLKVRTEIFNVNSEPEYTIYYEYDYY